MEPRTAHNASQDTDDNPSIGEQRRKMFAKLREPEWRPGDRRQPSEPDPISDRFMRRSMAGL